MKTCKDCRFFERGELKVDHSHCENIEYVAVERRRVSKGGTEPACNLFDRFEVKTKR